MKAKIQRDLKSLVNVVKIMLSYGRVFTMWWLHMIYVKSFSTNKYFLNDALVSHVILF
jgi:hypothetical protein